MPDVFLSYAREDRERARVLAHALESDGWSVDVSYRKTGTFLVRNDGPVILKVENNHDTVRYTVRLAQTGSERGDVEPTLR